MRLLLCVSILFVFSLFLESAHAVVQDDYRLSINEKTVYELCESIAGQSKVGLLADASAVDLLKQALSIKARDVKWADLQFLCADTYGLAVNIDDDYLRVTANIKEDGSVVNGTIGVYDTRLLCMSPNLYPGPRLGIPEETYDNTGIPSMCTEVEGSTDFEIEDYIDFFYELINEGEEGVADFSVYNTQILALADKASHQSIVKFLDMFEDAAASQIHCRVYDLTDKEAALGNRFILNEADWVSLDARQCIGNFTMLNQMRNHFYCGDVTAYISDLDVVGDNYDPVITHLGSGLVIDADIEMTVGGIVLTLQAQQVSEPSFVDKQVKSGDGKDITVLKEPRLQSAHVQDARLVPYNGASIIRLGDKIYALECSGTAPQAMNVFKK